MSKRSFRDIIFSLIIILIIFVIVESVSRIIYNSNPKYKYSETKESINERTKEDPILGWIWTPGYEGFEEHGRRRCYYRINSDGFRDREFSLKKPDGVIRILCLGDSITEGPGVDNNETYPKLLEAMLNTNNRSQRYEVLNCGVGDYGIGQEYLLLREKGLRYQPDIVILGYYLNDGRPFSLPKAVILRQPMNRFLKQSTFCYFLDRSIKKLLINIQYKKWAKDRFVWESLYDERTWLYDREIVDNLIKISDKDWGVAWTEGGAERVTDNLNKILELTRQYNFKLIVISFPLEMQVYAEGGEKINLFKPQEDILLYCKEHNVHFLNLLSYFRDNKEQDIFYDYCHYTPLGLKLVAQQTFEFLKSEILN